MAFFLYRDFPNGWAPLQHMIAEGLVRSGSEKARPVAQEIVVKWIRTNYAAFKETGAMHEKYDVEKCGASGGGGEYKPQVSKTLCVMVIYLESGSSVVFMTFT